MFLERILQRRPSFSQASSGDWNHSRKHHGNHSTPTAASMAEQQDEDEEGESSVVSDTTKTRSTHAAYCRCFENSVNNTTDRNSNQSTGTANINLQPPGNVCTCQLSCVTLGGVTAPDGSRTPLTTLLNAKKPRRTRIAKPTVIFNVGGQVFETYRSTLKRFKNSFFADDDKMRVYFRPSYGDYFFDRDPAAFNAVLNYLRTGELHVPTTMCGPALQTELEFWGIDELDIERCCWTQYNTWKTQSRSLEKLEYDRKFSTTQNLDLKVKSKGCWGRCQRTVWVFLQDPVSSRPAKVYAWISIIFVFVSIFSFCAETHPIFRVRIENVGQFAKIYEFFNLESRSISKENYANINKSRMNNSTMNESSIPLTLHTLNESVTKESNVADLPHPSLLIMDLCCLMFFTIEYITRFVCSPSKVNFLKSFQNIIDFVAISPDYVELLFLTFDPVRREGMVVMDLMFILRMLRLCRIFRLIRHVPGLWILLYTLKASFNELMLMCVFLLIGMVVFATLMHFAEGKNGFANIPVGFWWSVVTMTTVGYGDMFPQTAAGYVIGSCCAVAGLLMIAFTVPIIVSNFVLYYTHVQYGLARRDREMDRLTEEQARLAVGDEEMGNECNGSRTDVSMARHSSRTSLAVPNSRTYMDRAAVVSGESLALTSSTDVIDDVTMAETHIIKEGKYT